ncbi:MAG: NAD-dependent epimerase/dehydratase family protein [Proteobacteria bacterium]|nr:NAD-dependent epimerase/dehydratase family protein [Pseudomonadota bacterium]
MKIVITGGTGFLGLNLARAIIKRGTMAGPSGRQEEVDGILLFDQVIPDRLPDGLDSRVTMQAGDISDRDTVFALVDRDDISVFHLASVVSGGGEKDFDLAMRVNLDGGRHVFEAARARNGLPRVVFASSVAVFGGSAMPKVVGDTTKQTPQTTYGLTKAIGELMVNDYTRKGFFDGRTVRLPTIFIRPGKPNAAASSFASGVFREPLNGEECVLPVRTDVQMALLGYRNAVAGFVGLHEAEGAAIGDDRAVVLPSGTYTVEEMIEGVKRVAAANDITLGPITVRPDPAIEAIVAGWATHSEAPRAEALGLPNDESLDRVIQDYIDDFMPTH